MLADGASPAGLLGTPSATTPGKRLKLSKEEPSDNSELVAIKKFKPDKEGEVVAYTGISQSAIREIMINREICHENVTALREVMLEDKSIYLVFEFAEHDFLQIIHHHSSNRSTLPLQVYKSLLWQLLNGVSYLHDNWIMHRDLKPANILVTSTGVVKIGDLGLARIYQDPLQSLYSSDKIVVTVWYRAPELLLGARHYTPAIDQWSVGCIVGELLGLRPMFKGEEAKVEIGKKSGVPFQKDQMTRVLEVLGPVDKNMWPGIVHMPDYPQLARLCRPMQPIKDGLEVWFRTRIPGNSSPTQCGIELMRELLTYDPTRRCTARESLKHKWWTEAPLPQANAFIGLPQGVSYPHRRVTQDEDPKFQSSLSKPSFATTGNSGIQQFQQPNTRKRNRLE